MSVSFIGVVADAAVDVDAGVCVDVGVDVDVAVMAAVPFDLERFIFENVEALDF